MKRFTELCGKAGFRFDAFFRCGAGRKIQPEGDIRPQRLFDVPIKRAVLRCSLRGTDDDERQMFVPGEFIPVDLALGGGNIDAVLFNHGFHRLCLYPCPSA